MKKWRIRVLTKLAQQTANQANQPASNQQGAQPSAVPGPNKSPSPKAHEMNASLNTGWGRFARNVDDVVALIDKLIIAGTNGQYNFKSLYLSQFKTGVSGFDQVILDAISLGRTMFAQLLNNSNQFTQPLPNNDMKQRAGVVAAAPELANLTRINPNSPLGASGVTYTAIRDAITTLYSSIPNQ